MDNNINAVPMAFQRLIDAVVHNLPHAVHEAPLVGGADVHAGPFAHGLEPLQDGEVSGGVGGGAVGHAENLADPAGRGGLSRRRRDVALARRRAGAAAGALPAFAVGSVAAPGAETGPCDTRTSSGRDEVQP